jgi:Uma2 family endonuclease
MAIAVRPPQTYMGPLTYDDVQKFPDDGFRYELVDGELLVSPSPATSHQVVVTNLVGLFLAAVPPDLQVIVGPVDWYVRPTTYFAPDLVVVRREGRKDHRKLLEPPVLVVEEASPATRLRDLGLKRRAYEDAGLPWYWVVEPKAPSVSVERLVDGRFMAAGRVEGDGRLSLGEPFAVEVSPAVLVA